MDDVVWLDPYDPGLQPLPRARVGSRAAADSRRRAVARAIVTGACLTLIAALSTASRPGTASAQPGTDGVFEIPVHPEVPTIMLLPDEITRARVTGSSIRVTRAGRTLHVRPRPGVSTGLEALLEVETMTMLLTFRLHVVERFSDAREELVVVAMESEQRAEEGPPGTEPVSIAKPAPRAGPTPGGEMAPAPRFDLIVQAVVAPVGNTSLDVAGYQAKDARQRHRAFGIRIAGRPHGAWWAIEANLSGEWLVSPMVHTRGDMDRRYALETSGPWLRADVGMRVRAGTRLMPTGHAGIGLQAHHRDRYIDKPTTLPTSPGDEYTEDMPFGTVLTVGMGLEYRIGDVLLGLELHAGQGVPNDYRSVSALLSVGFLLKGE